VKIGDSVTSINSGAFEGCTRLASVKIGDSVTSIGIYAFNGCTNLASVLYTGTKKQWKKIRHSIGWKKDSSIRSVECSDGTIRFWI
jgi:hypothetical protein